MRKLFTVSITLVALTSLTAATNYDIANTPVLEEYSAEDLHCLALNIYHEARNESLAGQVAVADVTLNRVYDTRYPDTICGVVHQTVLSNWHLERGREVPVRNKCQFSWYCDGKSDEPKDGDSWSSAKQITQNFLTYGGFRGITEGATHYHASYVNPNWVNDRGMHMVGSIGEHIFYRWD